MRSIVRFARLIAIIVAAPAFAIATPPGGLDGGSVAEGPRSGLFVIKGSSSDGPERLVAVLRSGRKLVVSLQPWDDERPQTFSGDVAGAFGELVRDKDGRQRHDTLFVHALGPDILELRLHSAPARKPSDDQRLRAVRGSPLGNETDAKIASRTFADSARVDALPWLELRHVASVIDGRARWADRGSGNGVRGELDRTTGAFELQERADGRLVAQWQGVFLTDKRLYAKRTAYGAGASRSFVLTATENFATAPDGSLELRPRVRSFSNSKRCVERVVYPELGGSHDVRMANAALAKLWLRGPRFIEAYREFARDVGEAEVAGRFLRTVNYQAFFLTNDLVSVSLDAYEYTGGAHGSDFFESYVLDVAQASLHVLRADLTPEGEQRLRALSVDALREQYRSVDLVDAGFDQNDAPFDPSTALEALRDEHGRLVLVVTYAQNSVACYAMGMPRARIPGDAVRDFFRRGSVGARVFGP